MEQLSADQLKKIMGAEETQKLIALLQKDGGNAWSLAAQAARDGNYAAAQALLQPLMNNEAIPALARKLSDKLG